MDAVFQNVLEVSVQGAVIIAAVLVLRLALKKAPKRYICLLWLLAGLRLLLPFEIESGFSLQPDPDQVFRPQTQVEAFQSQPVPAIPEDAVLPEDVVSVTGDAFVDPEYVFEYPVQQHAVIDWTAVAAWVWLAGACGLGLYSLIAWLRLKRRVREAMKIESNVYECAGMDTAFVLGFFRPRIYIPMGLADAGYVLAHERTHIRRGDHWFKLLGFAALAVHWFNPLVWVGYILLCRDLEMACDEAVVRDMDLAQRKAYSAALLACSARRSAIAACPVAFGEVSVKQRIVSILNYRRPGFWLSLIAVIAVIFVAVCFLTSPGGVAEGEVLAEFYEEMDDIQISQRLHLGYTVDVLESEFDAVELRKQEFWLDGDMWYRTFEYATAEGSFTTCYAGIDGIQYAREYSRDIAGFHDRTWEKLPESSEANMPILTTDWRSLEVLEVRKERTDGGAYTVKLQGDLSDAGAHDTYYEKYWEAHLDEYGGLLCLHLYTHGEFYMYYADTEGVYETKSRSTLTVESWDDAWLEELQDLKPYREQVFAELAMEKCRLALIALQASEGCYITEDMVFENSLTGTGTAHVDLWLDGGNWLWIREESNADGTEKWYQMEADSIQYQRFEGDRYYNGGLYSTQWEVHDAPSEKPWLIQFDFDTVETVFLSHDAALGGQEMVVFNVITGEEDGFTTGYTLTFYLDDGMLESAVRTMERTYPDGPLEAERSTVTTTVVSADTQEAATIISQAHEEALAAQLFSWAEVVETYTWDAPQIHWDGFANTTPQTITSQADAIRAAEAECTIAYSAVYTHYDPDAQMWAVSFREGGEFGWTQDVYLDSNGITRLIVDGDPALSGQN